MGSGYVRPRNIWAPWDAVYFDAVSATSIEERPAFQQLVERALRRDIVVIGTKSSDRLFRNMAEARELRENLHRGGVEIICEDMIDWDPRNPFAWQNQTNQDQANEFWSRRTSEKVGKELERLSADGRPLGHLPEGFRIARREESFQGMQGKILAYEANEPFASIIVEGKGRYLASASFAALAAWSAGTECKGLTPNKNPMNWHWWRTTLLNPKYAGYHMPSSYQGFKPGTGRTPKRTRRKNGVTALVPCMLPALWPLDDFERVVEVSKGRALGAKDRASYKTSLLSSIAHDERCGHRMAIHSRRGEIVRMACGKLGAEGRHSSSLRTDIAESELDRLLAGLSFDDDSQLAMVEQELVKLAAAAPEVPTLRPDPEIGRLQAALATLGDLAPVELRAPIFKRLEELQARDEARRMGRLELVRRYRVSVGDLQHWADIWATADTRAKNTLLKAAGLRVVLGRDDDSRGPAVIRVLEVRDPMFGLALAAAIVKVAYRGPRGLEPSNATTLVRLPEELERVFASALGLEAAA